jgi:hypothetical protein
MYHLPILPISKLKPYGPDALYVHKDTDNVGDFYLMQRGRLYKGVIKNEPFAKMRFINSLLVSSRVWIRPFKSWKSYHSLHFSNSLHTYLFKISNTYYLNTHNNGLYKVTYERVSVYSVIFAHRFLTP